MSANTPQTRQKSAPERHRTVSWLLIGIIFVCAAVLRLYKLPETIRFYDDQGLDMVSILLLERAGELPQVGPFLSIPDVYTPPTYYLITQFFYNITRTVVGIVYAYALLNLLTVAILVWVTRVMIGLRAAVIMSMLLATSNIMIDHSRYFWQPYPMQLFLALWLLFVWWAYQSNRMFFLFCAALCYQIALSVYPSPVILLPLTSFLTYSWFRRLRKSSIAAAACLTAIILALTFAVVFSSQIFFEISLGFPTLRSIFLTPKELYSFHPLTGIWENSVAFTTAFFATTHLPEIVRTIATSALVVIAIVLYIRTRTRRIRNPQPVFWPLWIFAFGFGVFAFVPLEAHYHRSASLLPLAFLLLAELLSRAFQKNTPNSILGAVFLGGYVILNIQSAQWYWNGEAVNGIDRTKRVARHILSDMRKRNIPDSSVEFFYKIPNDPLNGSYGIYRILFWLMRDGGLSYPLNADNAHMPHNYSQIHHKPFIYIICRGFASANDIDRHCIRPVTAPHTYRQISQETFNTITVVLMQNEENAIPPEHAGGLP